MSTSTFYPPAAPERAWFRLTSGGPMLAVAVVWLTTAGHTLNFREMNAAKGWVSAEAYSLHSGYLLAVGLTLLAAPRLAGRLGPRPVTLLGLGLFIVGSAINGFLIHASLETFLAGRVLAGIGGGLVLFDAPNLLSPRWDQSFAWGGILLPPLGPAVIGGASFLYGWSAWEGGFLFEGLLALICFLGIAAMPPRPRPPTAPHWPILYWPWLVIAVIGFWYCLHWGQLQGWLESPEVLAALTVGLLGLAWACWCLWPVIDGEALRENGFRLVLVAFSGAVQFFHGTTMTIYSGLFVNYNVWQRSWLVWSMPLGVALALGLASLWLRRAPLGRVGALVGLLFLAAGMSLLNRVTMEWPYWLVQNSMELNWFQAPLHWEQAPGRVITGFGLGLLMASVTNLASRRTDVEIHVRQLLPVVQTISGGLAIGVLVTWLLTGHQTHYSYTAEASTIQAQEYSTRMSDMREALIRSGLTRDVADRQTLSLFSKAVHYQADNLTYAEIYGAFCESALVLAGLVTLAIVWGRRRGGPLGHFRGD
jgi:MFS family permease